MKRTLAFALMTLLLLAACRPAADTPALPTTAPTAAVAPTPTAGVTPATPPGDEPTAAPVEATTMAEPTAEPDIVSATPTPATGPVPLFDGAWDDRAIYTAGLLDSTADDVPGAPVYHIEIDIDPSLAIVKGRQMVYYTNQEDVALAEVYFHLHPNLLASAIFVNDVTVDGAAAATELSGEATSILRVALPEPLAPGATTTISMRFDVIVTTEIGRNYGVLAFYDGILALAHFYPMVAVYDQTGWNTTEADIQGDLTYSDAGYYRVRVTAPASVTLVGSGTETTREAAGDAQTVTYAAGPARDFYLAAGDFIVLSDTVGGTTINSYAPAELEEGAAMALDVAAFALDDLSRRLSPYPYTELDIVTTPTSALGIEYPGLIVGAVRMYDVGATSQSGTPYDIILESTTAHEVVHQWHYNLVGNDQLDEPWLDESMTGYLTYRYYVSRYGQAAGDNYFENFYSRWQAVDQEEIPIGLPVRAYRDAEYGAIVYGRGPIFVRELEETLGRERFDAFLSDYAGQYRWLNSNTAAFRALAETHCACDLEPLFAEWVYE